MTPPTPQEIKADWEARATAYAIQAAAANDRGDTDAGQRLARRAAVCRLYAGMIDNAGAHPASLELDEMETK